MNEPLRIVSLISSATEILAGLGLGDQIVGVSHECDYPVEVSEKPRVTFSRVDSSQDSQAIDLQVRNADLTCGLYGIHREKICALQPDVIVTQSQCDVCAVRFADVAALVHGEAVLSGTRLVDLNPHSLEEVFGDIRRVAEATNANEPGREWLQTLRQRVSRISDETALLSEQGRPRVACIEWTDPLMLAANWTPELIHLAGGRTPNPPGEHSVYQQWEALRDYDPEVVVIAPCGFDLARSSLEAKTLVRLPGWQGLSAVKAGRVYIVDGNAFLNRSGPRLVDSVEILAHLLQPELFGPPPFASENAWCVFSA